MNEFDYERQMLISKIKDKINFCKCKNKIQFTDFLDITQKSIVLETFKNEKFLNYIINDDENEFDRNIIIMYPEKLEKQIVKNYYSDIVKCIEIKNPKTIEYEHRIYLSGIMKLGIKREKFGDIIINDNIANIIVLNELAEYLNNSLKQLTRFNKSEISIKDIDSLPKKEQKYENLKIIVPSLRLDNLVSEIAKCSREKSKQIIEEEKVFINNKCEYKISKNIKQGDIITIRGKGKFIFDLIDGTTKKNNYILHLKKYI